MAKISPVSIKYIIHAKLDAGGAIEKPDIIGAIFGQTEGLLGDDLEMRELQKSGKIGRIEVNITYLDGKTLGRKKEILISSLDLQDLHNIKIEYYIYNKSYPKLFRIREKVLLKSLVSKLLELNSDVYHFHEDGIVMQAAVQFKNLKPNKKIFFDYHEFFLHRKRKSKSGLVEFVKLTGV